MASAWCSASTPDSAGNSIIEISQRFSNVEPMRTINMSFRISIGDILMISGLAYRIGKTLTTSRKSAPGEFSEVQNQLFAISNALRLLSATLQQEGVPNTEGTVGPEEDEILSRMIENCQTTL
jgi:hypothetical protein